ncbi:cysteine desulfurase [Halobacillus kuroshimensis]|uniref:Cysteine desulfurase n=1 Tax=Halobacillus kuroshimensis TaxID=302481 RepID=A0ABS3E013_9BACI|nr:cysteine desulfurase family protein [Halobacillus kuroshimensis]MBN8236945.1 cysteine desulfurase [Halobacillus kuroshimensis]
MIYLDNSATTQPYPEVLASFQKAAEQYFANPSSIHSLGSEVERLLDRSRKQAASLLHVDTNEVIFTSGGTEGNNMAVKGVALQHQNRGKHLITTSIEHPSVMEAFRALESLGFEVTYIDVNRDGLVDAEAVMNAVRPDTILVSVMSVNNELGSIQPIKDIGRKLKAHPKIHFHVDHVQGLGKIDLPMNEWGIDLCTISGHKIHGVKGTGALLVRKHVSLFPMLHGGSQEAELRAGTENLPGTVAFVKALRILKEKEQQNRDHLWKLRARLREALRDRPYCVLNSPEDGVSHITNFSIPGLKPEVVIHALGQKEIYISTKSACSSKQPDVSAVLKACNFDYDRTTSALRVSFSSQNTEEDIKQFVDALDEAVHHLQAAMR